ncbi:MULTISPECIES: hypothetical protein [unclassified Streptomyces]|uniref:hypothetical protein n=1 Tax=unclassified Streptomyces TaxID=2593676 RepID=UPI00380C1D67
MAAALPSDGSLPGYSVTGTPKTSTGGGTSDPDVRPEACRPLWDARAGVSVTSVARAWVAITPSGFAPPTEVLTFAGYGPDRAEAYVGSLDKALDACPSLSFVSRNGDRTTADVERVASPGAVGDATVSFRVHWTVDLDGFESDTFGLITTVRAGEATVTAMSDISVGSRLPASKRNAFIPKPDLAMLKSQADALREAQAR